MGVSKNNATPKSSVKNMVFHYFHHPFCVGNMEVGQRPSRSWTEKDVALAWHTPATAVELGKRSAGLVREVPPTRIHEITL